MDPIGILASWAGGKIGDALLRSYFTTDLQRNLLGAAREWVEELPEPLQETFVESLLNPPLDPPPVGSRVAALRTVLKKGTIPTEESFHDALLENWRTRRSSDSGNLTGFFGLEEQEASGHLSDLAETLARVCAHDDKLFRYTAYLALNSPSRNPGTTVEEHCAEILSACRELDTEQYARAEGVLEMERRHNLHRLPTDSRFALLRGLANANLLHCRYYDAAGHFRAAAAEKPLTVDSHECNIRAFMAEQRLEEALKLASACSNEYPDEPRFVALRIRLDSALRSIPELLAIIPSAHIKEPKVLLALAIRAHQLGEFGRSGEFAEEAEFGGVVHPILCLARGDREFQAVARAEATRKRSVARGQSEIQRIRAATQHYSRGLESRRVAPADESILGILAVRYVDAMAALETPQLEIGEFIRSARKKFPRSADLERAYSVWLAQSGAVPEAVEVLRSSIASREDAQSLTELASLQLSLGGVDNFRAARDHAEKALDVATPDNPRWTVLMAATVVVRSSKELKEYSHAERVLKERETQLAASAKLLKAELCRAQGDKEEEHRQLVLAVNLVDERTSVEEIESLAIHLVGFGDYRKAIGVLAKIDLEDRNAQQDKLELYASIESNDSSHALELAARFRSRHGWDADTFHLELGLLEDNDPEKAVALADSYLRENPGDRLVTLRRALTGLRHGRPDWVEVNANELPDPAECDSRNGRAAAQVLIACGKADEALAYAFALFRANRDSGDAREALLDVVYKSERRPKISAYPEVREDCAVHLVDGYRRRYTVILETGASPNAQSDEFAPESAFGTELLGRRVGDQVSLGGKGLAAGIATVESIESKYLHWSRKLMEPSLGGSEVEGAAIAVPIGDTGEEVRGVVQKLVSNRRQSFRDLLSTYRSHKSCSLHMLGEHAGSSTFELWLQLMGDESEVLKTPSTGSGGRLDRVIIVDQTVIATLLFLERRDLVSKMNCDLRLSPSTAAFFRKLPEKVPRSEEVMHVGAEGLGGLAIRGYSSGMLSRIRDDAKGLSNWVECAFQNHPSTCWLRWDKSDRETYVKAIGRAASETVAISVYDEYVLWTDDFVQGQVAVSLGASAMCTTDVLAFMWKAGDLSEIEYLGLLARLFGAGLTGVVLTAEQICRLGDLLDWSASSEPLSSLALGLRNRGLPVENRLSVGGALVVAAIGRAANSFGRNAIVDQVLQSTRVLGLGDNSFGTLIARCKSELSAEGWEVLNQIVKNCPPSLDV